MVDLDSTGQGAGSVVWVDEYKRLHVGPESAGAKVGICYKYDRLTVTDINVALGYVDSDYFLGGQVKLDKNAALDALKKYVADPLGLDIYEAGAGVLQIINGQMNDLLRTMVATKGYDTHDFTMIYYGGAGPVHMYGFAEDIEFQDIITLPWAAGFSAFGAACAEYMHRYNKGTRLIIPPDASISNLETVAEKISISWKKLETDALEELRSEGIPEKDITFRYGVSARYTGQIESFDTDLETNQMESANDVKRLINTFEEMYAKVYPEGSKFSGAGYTVTEVNLEAVAKKPKPVLLDHKLSTKKPEEEAFVEKRKVFHKTDWIEFSVWEMANLKAGNEIVGPSIIRDPMTTVVIPPKYKMTIDKYMVLHYQKAQ